MKQRFGIAASVGVLLLAAALAACGSAGKSEVENGEDVAEDKTDEGDAPPGETPGDCAAACAGLECGNIEGCTCGECGNDQYCDDKGKCVDEDLNCGQVCAALGYECDVDPESGCDCGACEIGELCGPDFLCWPAEPPECEVVCGEEGVECGIDTETGCDCGLDCGPDMACNEPENKCEPVQPPECAQVCLDWGYVCGNAGETAECFCGDCVEGYGCDNGMCVAAPCYQECQETECGPVAGGCDCGVCPDGFDCVKGECKPMDTCDVTCIGIECGPADDACYCGTCNYGTCVNGECECTPNCGGKQCGSDGCGGSCGACPGAQMCAWDGKCYATCDPALIEFSDTVQKVVTLSFGDGGHPGQAVDVDDDPATCSPQGDCELGLDNNLSAMFKQLVDFVDLGGQLQEAVNDGSLVMLMEFPAIDYSGLPFTLNMFMGEPVKPKNQCDFLTQKCEYWAAPESIDGEACKPVFWFDNATFKDGVLHAGGPGYFFTMMLSLIPGIPLKVTLKNAQILAAELLGGPPGQLALEGVIGGAMSKDELIQAVKDIPDNVPLVISKDMLVNLLNLFITNDIDTDGDGEFDAASMAMIFSSISGIIFGVGP